MKIRGVAKAVACGKCGHKKPEQPAVLEGADSYQYFEVRVGGKRIGFHVAKAEGETDVCFSGGMLTKVGGNI